MLGDKGSGFCPLAQNIVAPHDHMFVDENFLSPLVLGSLYFQRLAIGGWAKKSGVDLQQWMANDPVRLFKNSKRR